MKEEKDKKKSIGEYYSDSPGAGEARVEQLKKAHSDGWLLNRIKKFWNDKEEHE